MGVNEALLRGVDLNLLVVFLVIYREQNLSRSAALLNVGQPAVSASLVKLRRRFDDPLFNRGGRGMVPTAKAHRIADDLLPVIKRIEALIVLNGPFDR
ncbi:MAG: LysR family transcriptional regulator [Janthinobacterium lividum]